MADFDAIRVSFDLNSAIYECSADVAAFGPSFREYLAHGSAKFCTIGTSKLRTLGASQLCALIISERATFDSAQLCTNGHSQLCALFIPKRATFGDAIFFSELISEFNAVSVYEM